MALTLLDVPLSPFAQKVKIVLREKQIPFTLQPGNIGVSDPVLLKANPRGEVPALIDGSDAVWDSTIILEYIEEKWPAPPMLPQAPLERARSRQIEEICDGPLEAVIFGVAEVVFFKRAEGELQARLLGEAKKTVAQILAWLEEQLGQHPYFNGESFGRADAAVFPHVMNCRAQRMPPAEGSRLAAWLDRCLERPSIQQTLAEQKAGIGDFKALAEKFGKAEARRQYRDYRLDWMLQAGGLQVVQEGLAKGNIRFGGFAS